MIARVIDRRNLAGEIVRALVIEDRKHGLPDVLISPDENLLAAFWGRSKGCPFGRILKTLTDEHHGIAAEARNSFEYDEDPRGSFFRKHGSTVRRLINDPTG